MKNDERRRELTNEAQVQAQTDRESRLLACLIDLTLHNAREACHEYWEEGDEESYEALLAAIERCEGGEGTDEDWDVLIEETAW